VLLFTTAGFGISTLIYIYQLGFQDIDPGLNISPKAPRYRRPFAYINAHSQISTRVPPRTRLGTATAALNTKNTRYIGILPIHLVFSLPFNPFYLAVFRLPSRCLFIFSRRV